MKEYKSYTILNAEPEEVYAALTNAATLRLITGDEAVMSAEPGEEFSLWEGNIAGRNISFIPGKEIVQEWYFEDDGPEHEASVVTMRMHPHKKGTSLEVKHINIPEEAYENITEGWEDVYLASLVDFYA